MESVLKSLREQYQSGDFEAVKTNLLENKDAFAKGEFHYNLGTVYSKTGNYAVGRYHLEKALFEGYDSMATKHNLKSIQDKLGVYDLATSKSVDDVLLTKSLSYGPDFYICGTLILLIISLVLFYKKAVTKWVLPVLVLIALAPIGFKYLWLNKLNIGITFNEAEVYEGPSGIFEKTGKIPSGAKVIIGKTIEGWMFVQKPVDYVGWVKTKDLGVLK